MVTQHLYSRKVGGLVLLGTLAALYGGCAKSVSTDKQAVQCRPTNPCLTDTAQTAGDGNEEMGTIADEPKGGTDEPGGYVGYCEPGSSETTTPGSVAGEEGVPCTPGDRDEGASGDVRPWANGEGEGMGTAEEAYNPEKNEAGEYANHEGTYDEVPWTPALSDFERTPEPAGDRDGEYADNPTGQVGNTNETPMDDNSVSATADNDGTTMTDETTARPYEGYVSSAGGEDEAYDPNDDVTPEPAP